MNTCPSRGRRELSVCLSRQWARAQGGSYTRHNMRKSGNRWRAWLKLQKGVRKHYLVNSITLLRSIIVLYGTDIISGNISLIHIECENTRNIPYIIVSLAEHCYGYELCYETFYRMRKIFSWTSIIGWMLEMHGHLFINEVDLLLTLVSISNVLSLGLKVSIESTLHKVCGCYAVTFLNWAPRFDWYVVWGNFLWLKDLLKVYGLFVLPRY